MIFFLVLMVDAMDGAGRQRMVGFEWQKMQNPEIVKQYKAVFNRLREDFGEKNNEWWVSA